MNRVEKLGNAGRSYARVWREFIKAHSSLPNSLFCFFEGQDDPRYYGSRIDSYVFEGNESRRQNLWCKGKYNLIELHTLISQDSRFNNAWVSFFMDVDFDTDGELPNSQDVYITPCYAIENLYVQSSCFKRILNDEFGISSTDDEFASTVKLYEKRLEEFLAACVELNSWIFLQRTPVGNDKINARVNLQNASSEKLFRVKLISVSQKYSVSDLEIFFPNARKLESTELQTQVSKFSACRQADTFRGKYLMYFLKKILTALVEDSNKKKGRQHFQEKRTVTMQLSKNIISELSKYADTPPCLIEFLKDLRKRESKANYLAAA